jgi:CHAD domain-containing protein
LFWIFQRDVEIIAHGDKELLANEQDNSLDSDSLSTRPGSGSKRRIPKTVEPPAASDKRQMKAVREPEHVTISAGAGSVRKPDVAEVKSRLELLKKTATEFQSVVERCSENPEVERVHRARTTSRRLQALVESLLREVGAAGKSMQSPARKWLRQVRHIRRAAAPVRDLDVHRGLLAEILKELPKKSSRSLPPQNAVGRITESSLLIDAQESSSAQPATENERLLHQAESLEAWLRKQRGTQAELLQKQLARRVEKLARRQSGFFSSIPAETEFSGGTRSAATLALESFVRVSASFPVIDSANLHEFRKLIKRARYIAESDGVDPRARMIGKAFKRIQDSIGTWHDWQCLAEESATALDGGGADLTAWLNAKAAYELSAAFRVTERLRGRLVGEWLADPDSDHGRAKSGIRKCGARGRRKPSRPVAKIVSAPAMNF